MADEPRKNRGETDVEDESRAAKSSDDVETPADDVGHYVYVGKTRMRLRYDTPKDRDETDVEELVARPDVDIATPGEVLGHLVDIGDKRVVLIDTKGVDEPFEITRVSPKLVKIRRRTGPDLMAALEESLAAVAGENEPELRAADEASEDDVVYLVEAPEPTPSNRAFRDRHRERRRRVDDALGASRRSLDALSDGS